jgi:dUTP pyrophosphatase
MKSLLDIYGQYMILRIFVRDEELRKQYDTAAKKHNSQNIDFINAGFDLFVPTTTHVYDNTTNKIDMEIICAAEMVTSSGKTYNTGYYLYPRSSLSKTPLRLANSVGIIDAGYRGHIIGMFDSSFRFVVNGGDRLLQICAPSLSPIYVVIVDDIDVNTERGNGGFGSTGL